MMPQYLHHNLKLHHLHFTGVNALYISLSLQAFSSGLIGIFVPIYIYTLGFTPATVALFFIVSILTSIIIYPISAKLVNLLGPQHIIALSYCFLFCYTLLLFLLPGNNLILYPAAILGGAGTGMFWMARHIDFAAVISNKSTIKKLSTLLIFSITAQALSPFIGGVIATQFGIGYGLLATAIGLLIAIYPLLKTPEPFVPRKTKIQLLRTAPVPHMVSVFAMNAQGNVGLYTWPFFIYLVVNTYQNVGIISSASLIACILLLHSVGRTKTQSDSIKVLNMGLGTRSIVHLIRIISKTFSLTLVTNLLGDITDILVSVPYTADFYRNARKYDIEAYLVDMEIAGSLGKISVWMVLMFGSMAFDLRTGLIFTFIFASLLMPFIKLLEPENNG
jgi:MFS family permease